MARKIAQRGRGGRESGSTFSSFAPDLTTSAGLTALATAKGLPVPEENKAFSALRKVAGILNTGSAFTSGLVSGALDPKTSALGTAFQRASLSASGKELKGFSDTYRDIYGTPETRTEKIAVGVGGFIADVLFDPLTYLTFGMGTGIKLSTGVLSKSGTKLFQEASTQAARQYGKKASRITQLMFEQATGKKGLTSEAAEEFLKKGVDKGTVQTLRELGPTLLDKGGIKFFGKTLVKSSTLAKTPVGKAAKRLGETEIVTAIKNTLGRTFVADFGKNPKVVEILDKARRTQAAAMKQIIEQNKQLFAGLNDDQMSQLFNTIFEKKMAIIKSDEEIQKTTIEQLNKLFPELKVSDPEKANQVLKTLEDVTQKQVEQLRKRIDNIVGPLFKSREEAVASGRAIGGGKEAPFAKIDQMHSIIKGLRAQLASLRQAPGIGNAALASGNELVVDMTPEALEGLQKRLIYHEEERLAELIDDLATKLEMAGKETNPKLGKRAKNAKVSELEVVAYFQKRIDQLQKDFGTKEQLLQRITGSRKAAKALQKGEKLLFPDEAVQKVADRLFEGDDPIVARFAKLAGIPEEDAIKFYIPSLFKDKLAVKDFAMGRHISGANLNFKKKFTGKVNDQLITNPFEAYSLGQIQVATARVKTNAVQSVIKSLGRPITELTEKQAKDLGMKKWSRSAITDGGNKIEAWLPESVIEELNRFIEPSLTPIDDLAKSLGFDWATGLFKGYVTSLFPAFHVRNIVSNQFNNMLKIGMDVANVGLQSNATKIALGTDLTRTITTKTGKKITLKEIRDQVLRESDVLDEGAFSKSESLIADEIPKMKGETSLRKFNPLNRENVALQVGRKIGTKAEQQAKMVNILSAVMEGKSVKEGVKQAEEALFNYSKLSDFERVVMRRMIPFYTFARKNAELQIRALARTPGRVATQMKMIDSAGEAIGEPISQEDIEGLPSFVLDGLGIKGGAGMNNKYGQPTFLTGFGLPIEAFLSHFSGNKGIVSNAVADVLTMANPLIKFQMEKATGQDFFRGRPIEELNNATELKSMFDMMPEPVANEFKELIKYHEKEVDVIKNGKKVGKKTVAVADPFVLHFMRNMFTSRIQSTVGFLSSEEESGYAKALRAFTGVRGWSIDQEYQEYIKESERMDQLQKYLKMMGVVKTFERAYEPKPKVAGYL